MKLQYAWEKKEWRFLLFLVLLVAITIFAKNAYYYSESNDYRLAREHYLAMSPSEREYHHAMYKYALASQSEYERLLHHSSLLNYVSRTRYFNQAKDLYQRLISQGNMDAVVHYWQLIRKNSGYEMDDTDPDTQLARNLIAASNGDLHAIMALNHMYSHAGLHASAFMWQLVLNSLSEGKYPQPSMTGITTDDREMIRRNAEVLLQYISPH